MSIFRSVNNQCWRIKNTLINEEKFKFLLHAEKNVAWLGQTDQEISKMVENVTKTGGFYKNKTFDILTTISVQCTGNDTWKFPNGTSR